MASTRETLDNAQAEYDKYNEAAPNPDGTFTVDGKNLSATEYNKLLKAAKSALSKAKKAFKAEQKMVAESKVAAAELTASEQRKAAETVKQRQQVADELDKLQKRNQVDALLASGRPIPRELSTLAGSQSKLPSADAYQARIAERQTRIDQLTQTIFTLSGAGPAGIVAPGTVTTPAGPAGPQAGATPTTTTGATGPGPMGALGPTTAGPGAQGQITPAGAQQPSTAPTAPSTPGRTLGQRRTNKKGVTFQWDGTKWVHIVKQNGKWVEFTKPTVSTDWEASFKQVFPQQAWMFDLDRTKYADVFQAFKTGYDGRMWETSESQTRFLAMLNNTSFFKELQFKQTVGVIKSLVGDLGIDTANFNKFIVTASNMGWEGDTLKQEVFKEAFKTDTTTGQFVNPVAVARAKESADWLNVKNIGRAYFSNVDDKTIENVLTGTITSADVDRQQRSLAKAKYAHLGDLIDQGLTLQGISEGYKSIASTLLEKDENAIDMSQADYEVALNFNDNGNKRMLTTGEWERMLKSDDRYGWGDTENAKQIARSISQSLVASLGRFG